jgi:hypothetical protein
MTILFDGPPGTKLGEGETDGMHELLADDDLPTYELPDEPDEEELVELAKAAGPILSAAEAAERKVADRIYTALRAAASAAEQIAGAAHTAMSPDAAVGGLRRSGLARLYGLAIDRLLPVMEAGGRHALDGAIVQRPIAQLEKADPARLTVNIGQRNGKIASFLEQYRMDKIRELTNEQESTIRRVVIDGMAAGHPPAKMAILIRENIGLTPYQAAQVQNYRADLETLNTTALQRELRDKRFNMPVARAIADGKPLTPEQINRFTAQYHDNWLRMRASMIARTEALHAANMGGRLAIEQAIKDGVTEGCA